MSFVKRVIVRRFCTASVGRSRWCGSTAASNNKDGVPDDFDHLFFTGPKEVGSKPRRDRIPDPDSPFMRFFVTRSTTSAKAVADFIRYRPTPDQASIQFWKLCDAMADARDRYPGYARLTPPPDPYSDLPFDPYLPYLNRYHRKYSLDALLRDPNIDVYDYDDYYNDDEDEEEDDDPDWSPEKKVLLLFNALQVDRFKHDEFHRAHKSFADPCAWAKSVGFPDSLSYQIMIKGSCIQGLVDRALSLLDEMHRRDMHAAPDTYYTLVAAFDAQGRSDDADQVWNRMEDHEQVLHGGFSHHPRIEDLVSEGLLSKAVKLVDNMDPPYGNSYDPEAMARPGCAYQGKYREEAKRMHRGLLICGCDPKELDILMTNSANRGYETALRRSLLQKTRDRMLKNPKTDEAQKAADLTNSEYDDHQSKPKLPFRSFLSKTNNWPVPPKTTEISH